MGKRSKKVKTLRRHAFVEKAPWLASIILAVAGWLGAAVLTSFVNGIIKLAVPSYPYEGMFGVIIGAAIVMLLYKRWFRPEFEGFMKGGRPGTGFRLGLIFVAYFATAVIFPDGGELTFKMPTFLSLSMCFAAGILEELCLRGLMLGTLMRQCKDDHKKTVAAVLLSSAVFGAAHLTNIISGAGVFVSVMQAISAGFLGVAFAAVYVRCGNLLVPMIFHTLTDIIAFALNPAVSETGVVGGTYKMGDALDDAFCFVLMIIGLWFIRSGVHEEIREVWNQKWKPVRPQVQDEAVLIQNVDN